jgi:hypothetical protein
MAIRLIKFKHRVHAVCVWSFVERGENGLSSESKKPENRKRITTSKNFGILKMDTLGQNILKTIGKL